jgi:hypothetical protein
VQPSATSVNVGNALTYTVTALDYTGAPATSYTGTVAITSSDSAATLPANQTLSSGTGTFQVTFGTKGLQTVTATDTTTQSINGTSQGVEVLAAGSARRDLTTGPARKR